MPKLKVRVIGRGTVDDPWRVNLPAYKMVIGTEEYVAGKLISVEVIIPDDECNAKGEPDKDKIRAKYKGQPAWDRPNLIEDI